MQFLAQTSNVVAQGEGKLIEQFSGGNGFLATLPGEAIGRDAMPKGAESGSLKRFVSASQQTTRNPRQQIAAASASQD